MNYRKKPVVIQALQYEGSMESYLRIREAFPDMPSTLLCNEEKIVSFHISTLEGVHIVSKADFIIRGIDGEYYPCKPNIFELTYDAVN
jgi:hypothetical protein